MHRAAKRRTWQTVVLVATVLALSVALPASASIPPLETRPSLDVLAAQAVAEPPAPAADDEHFRLYAPGENPLAGAAPARFHLFPEAKTRVRGINLDFAPRVELRSFQVIERTGFALFGGGKSRRWIQNRHYDPELGRFLQPDPLGYVDGPNLYQYGLNSPVNFSDPMGLQAQDGEEGCLDSFGAFWNCVKEPVVRAGESARELGRFITENTGGRTDPADTGLDDVAEATRLTGQLAGDTLDAGMRVADISGAGGIFTVGIRMGTRYVTKEVSERHLPELLEAGWEIVDDDVAESAARIVPRGEALSRFDALARRTQVTDEFLTNKVLRVHGPGSSIPGKSRFVEGFDVGTGIRSTLDSADSLILPNTQGRAGAIFIREFSETIGTNARGNPVTRLKVVFGDDGQLITAFPIR